MSFHNEQEKFWAGEFGLEYIQRNKSDKLLASNLNFFCTALKSATNLGSVLEFGANIGMNLKALKLLYPGIDGSGIEINSHAARELAEVIPQENIFQGSILDYQLDKSFDLVLIKGVLIHIHPDYLQKIYEKLVASTNRYLLVAEYYNPSPTMVSYRGHKDRLFKRDFAGEILEKYPCLSLIDYGFFYRRDPNFPQDDITWFLIKKG